MIATQKEAEQILSELEDLWKKYDKIYASFSDEKWNKKFGKDWTFADQPYHLAFFDRMVKTAISSGPNPKNKPSLLSNIAQINEWNEREFKKRPKNYTPQQSVKDFRESRKELRDIVKNQKNWDEKVWIPLFFGWSKAIDVLAASLVHSAGEYIELCLRIDKAVDLLPQTIKRRAGFMMLFMSLAVDKNEAEKRKFIINWNFEGRGPSNWTILVENGTGKLVEGKHNSPDLEMSMTLESFEKMLRKMKNPMLMMLTREIKVKGFRNMPVFAKLFPQP